MYLRIVLVLFFCGGTRSFNILAEESLRAYIPYIYIYDSRMVPADLLLLFLAVLRETAKGDCPPLRR